MKCDKTCICKGTGVVWMMIGSEPEKEICPYQLEQYERESEDETC